MDTELSKHVQDWSKQNGSKACKPILKALLAGSGFDVVSGTLLHRSPWQQSSEQSVKLPVELNTLQAVIKMNERFSTIIVLRSAFLLLNSFTLANTVIKLKFDWKLKKGRQNIDPSSNWAREVEEAQSPLFRVIVTI